MIIPEEDPILWNLARRILNKNLGHPDLKKKKPQEDGTFCYW
jgi:hypothetical protein